MKVVISSTAPHPEGLVLGVVVSHEKAGWIRFATTLLLVNDLSDDEARWLGAALNTRAIHRKDSERLEELDLEWD